MPASEGRWRRRELCPLSRAAGPARAPNYGADAKAERSEELVEAAGVERERSGDHEQIDGARLLGLTRSFGGSCHGSLTSLTSSRNTRNRLGSWRDIGGGGTRCPPPFGARERSRGLTGESCWRRRESFVASNCRSQAVLRAAQNSRNETIGYVRPDMRRGALPVRRSKASIDYKLHTTSRISF